MPLLCPLALCSASLETPAVGQAGVKSPEEESGHQRGLLCTSCVSCGQGCAASLPPALTNCPPATLSPGQWGWGRWGFFSSLEPSPRPDASSYFAPGSCPCLLNLTLKRDHTSLSGLSEGCQLPSDPIRSHQRPSVCVGEVRGPLWVGLGPLWGGAGRAQGQRPGDLVPPP